MEPADPAAKEFKQQKFMFVVFTNLNQQHQCLVPPSNMI
jgi:hypothetical protein